MTPFTKIFLAITLTAVLNISPAFLRTYLTSEVNEHLNLIVESNLSEHQSINQLAYYLQRIKSNIREILLELNSRPQAREINHAHEAVVKGLTGLSDNILLLKKSTIIGKELGSFNEKQESNSELKKAEDISYQIELFAKNVSDVLAVTEHPEDVNFYLALFTNTVEPQSRKLQDQIEEFKQDEFGEVRHELEAMRTHVNEIQKYVVIYSIITITISLLLGLFLARNIANSMINSIRRK